MARSNPIKGPLIFLAVSAIILALTIFVVAPRQETQREAEANAALLWGGLKREDILALHFKNSHGEFSLTRDSQNTEAWILGAGDKQYEADADAVTGLLSTMIAAKTEESLKAPALDQVGLDQPKFSVRVETSNASAPKRVLLIGNDTPVNYFVYAKWADTEDIFLTTRSLRFGIDKEPKDLRNKSPFKWKLEDLNSIEFSSLGRESLPAEAFTLKLSDAGWRVADPKQALISDVELQKWLDPILEAKADGFAPESSAAKAGSTGDRPVIKLKWTHKNGQQQAWVLSAKDILQGKTKVTEFYLSSSSTEPTYLMKPVFKDAFKVSLFQLREKSVTAFSPEEISKVKISGPTKTMTFLKDASVWTAESNFPGFESGQGVGTMLERVIKSFSNLEATKYHDHANSWTTGLAQPSRTIEFYKGETLVEKVSVGKKLSASEVIVLSQRNSSPASVLMDIEEIVPLKPEPYILKGSSAQDPLPGANKEKVIMEPTVKNKAELKRLPASIVKPGHEYTAEIQVKGKGLIEITFDSTKAPYTVSNFLHLARNKFYDGLSFHRVIPNFVAQGGDPVGNGTGGPGWMFDYESNDLKHVVGSISMAHAADPNTNGSQFFLVFAPQPHLDGVHTVFGNVSKGLEVMHSLKQGDIMEKVSVYERKI